SCLRYSDLSTCLLCSYRYSVSSFYTVVFSFFFLMLRRPPRSTLFPTRRSSDLRCGRQRRHLRAQAAHPAEDVGLTAQLIEAIHLDRKSTRLNSSHGSISYAVFCLKKKKQREHDTKIKQQG